MLKNSGMKKSLKVSSYGTGCSDSIAQTLQNENLRFEYMKNLQSTMPLKRVVFEKNAKDSYDIISRTPKISFIVPHKIEKLIKNKVKKKEKYFNR